MIAGLGCCEACLHLSFCHGGDLASAAVLVPGCTALHHVHTHSSDCVAEAVSMPGCWQPVLLQQWHHCPPWPPAMPCMLHTPFPWLAVSWLPSAQGACDQVGVDCCRTAVFIVAIWAAPRAPRVFLQGWSCTQVFEGHSHYVMQVALNPKDTNTFASASLDRTVKVRLHRL